MSYLISLKPLHFENIAHVGFEEPCIVLKKLVHACVVNVQGDPKKMSVSVFDLKSVLDVGFDFSACVLESEF